MSAQHLVGARSNAVAQITNYQAILSTGLKVFQVTIAKQEQNTEGRRKVKKTTTQKSY